MKKYEQVQLTLTEQMEQGLIQPGERLPSESELCSRFSVSRNVIRQALRNLEGEGFTETLKGIGTFCRARSSEKNRSRTIGFISFFTRDYIFPDIISSVDTALYPAGYHLILGQSLYDAEREKQLLERFANLKVEGIIMEPVYDGVLERSNAALIEKIIAGGIPVVFIDNTIPGIGASSITLNDIKAGREAAAYLTRHGHKRIAVFYQEDYLTKLNRKLGAEDFLLHKPEDPYQPLLVPFTGQGPASNAQQRAQEMIDRFDGSYSAIFCSSDADAMHLIEAADRRGIPIPETLSIIGFDNQHFASHARISLTTFAHPSTKVGRLAAKHLLDAITHPEETTPLSVTIDARMIERESVQERV